MLKLEGQTNGDKLLNHINTRLDEISANMEKMGIAEYVEMLHNPRRLFWTNFWAGIARGFGMAIGFTILAALVIYILQKIVILNMPLIGDFIADIINIVVNQLGAGGAVFHGDGGGRI